MNQNTNWDIPFEIYRNKNGQKLKIDILKI